MFAAGVEKIVSDHLCNPSRFDDEEIKAMERKASKKEPSESLFSLLCRQLFWGRVANARNQS